MLSLNQLFGVDPRDLQATATAYRFWRKLGTWPVPQPLGWVEFEGKRVLRVEFVEGQLPSRDFRALDGGLLGQAVARNHGQQSTTFGDVGKKLQQPVTEFYSRALAVVKEIAPRYAARNWDGSWPEVEQIFAQVPPAGQAVPMLLDWSESQFVWRNNFPYALVDVEASVYAPPELDLCFWELLLGTSEQAQKFRAGYATVRPFPDLTPYRDACRLILLALESEGTQPVHEWLRLPKLFG